jgi:hypothetical protein
MENMGFRRWLRIFDLIGNYFYTIACETVTKESSLNGKANVLSGSMQELEKVRLDFI